MATQVNSGLNSTQIFYTNTDTQTVIRAMIIAFAVAHGWELVSQGLATSDVFRSLDTGGTAGNVAHYSYVELDYSVASRVVPRQWYRWVGSAGVTQAQNTFYLSTAGAATVGTQSDVGQSFDITTGGNIKLNVARGRFYVLGSIPGRSGNITGGGSLVIERTRVDDNDIIGGSPACIFLHTGTMFSAQTNNVMTRFRWSCPVGIADGTTGLTPQCGDQAGFSCLETGEFVYSYLNELGGYGLNSPQNLVQISLINQPSFISQSTRAGAVFPNIVKNTIVAFSAILGALQGCCKQYNAPAGSLIQTKADIYGVPSGNLGADTVYEAIPGGIALVQ